MPSQPVGVIFNNVITVQVDTETFNKYRRDGKELLKAAKRGDAANLQRLIDQGAPVNFTDQTDHAAALHYIAAHDARPALRVVLGSGKCDFLIRDREGRLPSEIAREYGHDRAMARLLLIKEIRQAQAQDIDPGSLYKLSSRKPAS
jgi:ankyrin repeat protein